jgi:hypothetical protein
MVKPAQSKKADVVFSLLIFSTFAIAVLITLMLGASFYQRVNDMTRDGYDERTSLSYMWAKIKNSDNMDMISVGDFNGIPALLLYEIYGETTYVTRIYSYDGWVYELFSDVDLEMAPENGTPIIKTGAMFFEQLESGLIRVSAGSGSVLVQPRSNTGYVRGSSG